MTRQRVYSRVLRRHVLRCRRFEGGRVGVRKPPRRLPNGLRCVRRKKFYSPFFRKKVLRCAKYGQQPRFVAPVAVTTIGPAFPAWVEPPAQSAVFTPPEPPFRFEFEPQLVLPADAQSLLNRNRMQARAQDLKKMKVYRRLRNQMRRMQKRTAPTFSRWPQDRPRPKKGRS